MNEIVNTDYANWLQSISKRYRQSQSRAAVAVNAEMLKFYFGLGTNIMRMEKDQHWGSGFLKRLSRDLKMQMPEAECFSPRNLYYMRDFFKLYAIEAFLHQVGAQLNGSPATAQQIVAQIVQQGAEQFGAIDSEHSFLQLVERIRDYMRRRGGLRPCFRLPISPRVRLGRIPTPQRPSIPASSIYFEETAD